MQQYLVHFIIEPTKKTWDPQLLCPMFVEPKLPFTLQK
uniref:Uncharacterized protein n=1 Tax=Rhizophora mucronata TaxID=61149 RepID=A0A2P2QXR7_RHIMU